MSERILVEKAGQRLPIHPSTLEEHQRLGWTVAVDQTHAALKPKAESKPAGDTELDDLRKAYRAKFGKGAGPKWTADQIREKLAA